MGILQENSILLGLVGKCSFVCANVALSTLVTSVMWLVIDTAVVSNRCTADEVEASLTAR